MASNSFSLSSPPIFLGENYQTWVIKIKSYMQAFDLWDVVEHDKDPSTLLANHTMRKSRTIIKRRQRSLRKKVAFIL